VKFNEDISNVGNFSKSSTSSRGPMVQDLAVEDSPTLSAQPRISFENQNTHRASGPKERTQVEKLTTLLGTDLRSGNFADDFAPTLTKHDAMALQASSEMLAAAGGAQAPDINSETIEEPGVEPR
jgi:hypothetical protein